MHAWYFCMLFVIVLALALPVRRDYFQFQGWFCFYLFPKFNGASLSCIKQTVHGQIRHCIVRCLILVCTVCLYYIYHKEEARRIWVNLFLFVWFDSLRPINNLSVKQGRVSLVWTSTRINVSCSRTTTRLEVPSQALYHWATALPIWVNNKICLIHVVRGLFPRTFHNSMSM